MRKEIYATLYHKISTNDKPQHDRCPAGEDSWCSWQQAKVSDTLPLHEHKAAMSMTVFNAVQKIYEDLTADELLSRCLGGYTQNANESLNSVVWSMAPKCISSGKNIVDIATDIAAITYNDGLTGLLEVMSTLELVISTKLYEYCLEVDEKRVKAANRASSNFKKSAKKDLTSVRKKSEEENLNLEGVFYGAGIAE